MTPRRTFVKGLAAAGASLFAPASLAATPADDALRKHRIAAIEFRRVAQPWPRLVGKNSRLDVHGRGPSPEVCILKTDLGATGWGMIEGDSKQIRNLESAILGKTIDSLFAPSIGIRDQAYKGIDIPLHDLTAIMRPQLNDPASPSAKPAQGFWTGRQRTVGDARWRLVTDGENKCAELYDYQTDPGETRNHAEAPPEVVDAIRTQLE
jgi:hypothetical protein